MSANETCDAFGFTDPDKKDELIATTCSTEYAAAFACCGDTGACQM